MTAVINKLQRLLGLRVPDQLHRHAPGGAGNDRPLVLITHMEHHSNHTSWNECDCDVRDRSAATRDGPSRPAAIMRDPQRYPDRDLKIGVVHRLLERHRHPHPLPPDGRVMHRARRLLLRRLRRRRAVRRHRHAPGGPGAAPRRHLLLAAQVPRRAGIVRRPDAATNASTAPRSRPSRRRHRDCGPTPGASTSISTTSKCARTAARPASCRPSAPRWRCS